MDIGGVPTDKVTERWSQTGRTFLCSPLRVRDIERESERDRERERERERARARERVGGQSRVQVG